MSDARLDEEAIFSAALEKKSTRERSAYLAEACAGDVVLRRSVEELLALHPEADEFLNSPPVHGASSTSDAQLAESPGTVIGRYKLFQEIGEGGFGVVFKAEQQEPVARKVALKVIKPGMDTRQVIARFEAERQALAMMDHPHISRVLDAGTTETGRPYFVMELVEGVPITEYCDKNNLSIKDRLELFVDVCHAIQHAHQKGIIHRDIKPSNVMVTLHDRKPVVKVIDFGVSKALHQKLTEKTLITANGQIIGTPQYMSPEQAEMSGLDIDTRSDVYSLGILLYELLTGTTPLEEKRLRQGSYAEMQLIRDEEAPRPSARLSHLGDRLAVIAKQRGVAPKRLRQTICGELDWIVMRSVEKDRARRYETANGFAADVERYLNNEPVAACRPSAVYRFHSFARRNRTMLTAASLVAVALLAGTIVSARLAIVAAIEAGKAQEARQVAEDLRYVSDINRAMRALVDRDWPQIRHLLRDHHPSPDGVDRRDWEWRFLWSACRNRDKTPSLRHDGFVMTMAISNDGRTLVTGDTPGNLNVWDVATRQCLDSTKAHYGGVFTVDFSPDGSWLASGGSEIRLWKMDPHSRTLIEGPKIPTKVGWNCVAFSHDGKLVATGGKESAVGPAGKTSVVQLWDVSRKEILHRIPTESGQTVALVFHPEGKTLAAHCMTQVVVWKLPYADGDKQIWSTDNYDTTPSMTGLAYSPDGRLIAASWRTDGIELLNADTGEPIYRWVSTPPAVVSSVAFSPDGEKIAVGDHDKNVTILDTKTGNELEKRRGHHSSAVTCVRFTPDGRTLATSSWDKAVRLWRVDQVDPDEPSSTLIHHAGPVRRVSYSPDGELLATAGEEGKVVLLDVSTWQTIREFDATTFAFSTDSMLLAIRGTESVQLWDLEARPIRSVHSIDQRYPGVQLALSSDRKLAVVDGHTLQLWDLSRPTQPIAERGNSEELSPMDFWRMAFSPDGTMLAVTDWRGDLALLDSQTLKIIDRKPEELALAGWQVAFSPRDGHTLVTPYLDHMVKVWDVRGRRLKLCRTLDNHTDVALSAAFSGNGLLAIGCANGQVRLWDSETWTERATLQCHDGDRGIDSVAFSIDGNTLVTGGAAGLVRIHQAASPEEVIEAENRGDDPLNIQ